MLEQIVRLVDSGDGEAAIRLIESSGDARAVALLYDQLVRELYWTAKHLPALIAVANSGIRYCLAQRRVADSPEDSEFFGGRAKTIAANLASFLWPGWDEPGIELSPSDLETGRTAAALNLQLAVEPGRPAEKVLDAYWLVGAHCLAAHDPAGAEAAFRQSGPDSRPLMAGYVFLARIVAGDSRSVGEFDRLLDTLDLAGDSESAFAAEQLRTAKRVFVLP